MNHLLLETIIFIISFYMLLTAVGGFLIVRHTLSIFSGDTVNHKKFSRYIKIWEWIIIVSGLSSLSGLVYLISI